MELNSMTTNNQTEPQNDDTAVQPVNDTAKQQPNNAAKQQLNDAAKQQLKDAIVTPPADKPAKAKRQKDKSESPPPTELKKSLFEIAKENYMIKEQAEKFKRKEIRKSFKEGVCEECANFDILYNQDGRLIPMTN